MAQSLSLTVSRLKTIFVDWVAIIRYRAWSDVQFPFNSDKTDRFLMNCLFLPIENVLEHHSYFRYIHKRLYLLTKINLAVLRHNWNVVTSFLFSLVTIENNAIDLYICHCLSRVSWLLQKCIDVTEIFKLSNLRIASRVCLMLSQENYIST